MSKNKLSFESKNLVVDYISFNIDGYVQTTYLRKISFYLFESFGFNATFRRDQLNQREIFFSNDKNSYEVSFRHYNYNPKAKSFWEGTKLDFTGENATYFYSIIKQQKFDWKIFDLTNLTLARIDVNYLRESKIIDTNQIDQDLYKINQKYTNRLVSFGQANKNIFQFHLKI